MRVHVLPLREGVPADNGSRTMLTSRGAVREAGPYWDRMAKIGAVQVRPLPERDSVVMIRPVNGAQILTSGRAVTMPPKHKGEIVQVLDNDGADVKWTEAHEGALADGLIQFPMPSTAEQRAMEARAAKERDLAETEYDLTEEATNV